MKTAHYFILATFATFFAGCATMAPPELVNARSAYQYASEGPAKQLAPAELHKAHEALNRAEDSFQKDPDSYKTKDLAYVAQRKSEQAGALGSMAAATASKDRANTAFQKKQTEIVTQGKQDLRDAQTEIDRQAVIAQGKKALNDADKRTAVAQADLDKQAAVTAANDKAAIELKASEKRTADAVAALAALASVKEEERGLIVTLSGSVLFTSAESTLLSSASVLFKSDESTLLSSARVKLDQVATALLAIRARNLIVEGNTDSQGSDAYNQNLSQRRADAVRDYLVERGYPADHIQSRGRGEGNPIANNASPEGRANNRRVEIIIEREVLTSKK
jgi:outer membrane protein OmpA-like peptidoglycan-associated protein